jgi:hypothetical protein
MAATQERQALAKLGEQQGWNVRESGRADVYLRGNVRIRAIWQGDTALSGASIYQDEMMGTYTRELGTVRNWLQK